MGSTLVYLCFALLMLLNKAFLVTVVFLQNIRTNYLKTLLSGMSDKMITIISGSSDGHIRKTNGNHNYRNP